MKFFLDTAIVDEIRTAAAWGILDGVTTNPTLAAKVGRPLKETVLEICSIVGDHGTVSVETISLDAEGMVREAQLVTSWASNVVAKIPCTVEGLKAVVRLTALGIRTNVTLVFSATQGLLAMKAGAYYVSPFVGRLDDIAYDGRQLIEQLVTIKRNYGFSTDILAASVRGPLHVVDAALAGADICTMPLSAAEQLLKHPLTDRGLDRFLNDWNKIPEALRPF
ncbi:MAG TPA: fructose-6-phosphate aldolase [Symbiobacteriaceae bacterium]|nr:fructose-6-phosphate aldolase [Symbiobacteriaceae bacterium]